MNNQDNYLDILIDDKSWQIMTRLHKYGVLEGVIRLFSKLKLDDDEFLILNNVIHKGLSDDRTTIGK
jgi:hypothetical protein